MVFCFVMCWFGVDVVVVNCGVVVAGGCCWLRIWLLCLLCGWDCVMY